MSSKRTENFSYVRYSRIAQSGIEIFYDVPRFTPEKTTAEISVLTSIFLASFNQVPVFRRFSEPLAVTLCHVSLFNGIYGIDRRNNRQFCKMAEQTAKKIHNIERELAFILPISSSLFLCFILSSSYLEILLDKCKLEY